MTENEKIIDTEFVEATSDEIVADTTTETIEKPVHDRSIKDLNVHFKLSYGECDITFNIPDASAVIRDLNREIGRLYEMMHHIIVLNNTGEENAEISYIATINYSLKMLLDMGISVAEYYTKGFNSTYDFALGIVTDTITVVQSFGEAINSYETKSNETKSNKE